MPADRALRAWAPLPALAWLLLLVLPLRTAGQTYQYAPATFSWINPSTHASVVWTAAPGGPPDACLGGSPGAIDDDITQELPLGFTFRYGSTDYTSVRIMSNGRLQFANSFCGFGTQNDSPRTYPYPYPDANLDRTMRVYGADLDPSSGGSGRRVSYAALGTAPNRSFVATWTNIREWNAGGSSFNLQVILQENGEFIFQYGSISNTSGGKAQIGWQLSAADYGLVTFSAIQNLQNTAYRFYRPNTSVTPGAFNAFETTTPTGAVTGVIKTKIAGQSFTLALIALNTARTAVETGFVGTVTVQLLDASNNSGAMDTASRCRSSWSPILTLAPNPAFTAGNSGRISASFNVGNAWREVRVRVTFAGTTTVIGCSMDSFAIRPASFTSVQALDANDTTAGLTRALNNTSATGGAVHRAGRPFSVLGQAVSATGAVTSGYTGTPGLAVSSCVQPAGCLAGALSATLVGTSGMVSGEATYDEAGVISMILEDTDFAIVDASDSTAAERTIASSPVTLGRFVPDRYLLSFTAVPQFAAGLCAGGPAQQSFTFVGQPFAFGVAPVVLATPMNAFGMPLDNARPRYTAAHVTNTVSAAGAPVAFSGTTIVTGIAHGATSTITFSAGSFSFARGSTPIDSFTPTLSMTVNLADTTENTVAGNNTISAAAPLLASPIDFIGSASAFHYGRAQLRPSYGDVRRELYAPLEVQRFNGLGWIALPDAAACLVAPATSFAYSSATGLLDAGGGASNCASRVAATIATSAGRAAIRLDKPGAVTTTEPSAMTMTLNLLATPAGTSCAGAAPAAATTVAAPWLANPDGSNPSARLTWGRSRGELLGLRERFD